MKNETKQIVIKAFGWNANRRLAHKLNYRVSCYIEEKEENEEEYIILNYTLEIRV